jgi:hypothetical protein
LTVTEPKPKPDRTIEFRATNVKTLGDGLWWDSKVSGLVLLARNQGRKRSFRLRFRHAGKVHDVGIGPVAKWTLKDARDRAEALKAAIKAGQEPPKLVHKRGTPLPPKPANDPGGAPIPSVGPPCIPGSFRADAEAFDYHNGHWSANTRKAFRSVMANHVYPKVGDRQMADLKPADMVAVVTPLWSDGNKNTNSGRLLQYLPAIIAHAIDVDDVGRFPDGINVAAGLKSRLRKRTGRAVNHRRAIKWQRLPGLFGELLARADDLRALGNAFLIATRAPRHAEVRDMRWGEITDDAEWHVPAGVDGRMKNKRDSRVTRIIPLSRLALQILDMVRPAGDVDPDALVFPYGNRAHGLNIVLAEMGYEIDPHGFRTACKSWGIDNLLHPRDPLAIELEQDRAIGDPTSEAYRDTSMVGHRRILADRFAAFLRGLAYVGPVCVPDPFATPVAV